MFPVSRLRKEYWKVLCGRCVGRIVAAVLLVISNARPGKKGTLFLVLATYDIIKYISIIIMLDIIMLERSCYGKFQRAHGKKESL